MSASPVQAHSLGSYELLRKLGAGGMAEVFLAAHHMAAEVERLVVIKAMLPHLAEDEHFTEMFLREARVAALLSHPNVAHIHDVSVLDGRPAIVMEFLRGRDLWHVLKRRTNARKFVPPEAAAAMVAQAATGLHYAHNKRDDRGRRLMLVHRDISPHNLFVTREGNVRVLDFGVAKSRYQQHRTQSGVLKGKLAYMAPEQARSKEVDHRADQFALGVILWETLTGSRLFAREDPFQTMNDLFTMEIPPPSSRVPGLPAQLDAICERALQRDREARYPSCEELANDLRELLRSSSVRSESQLVADLLEDTIPSLEDREFYGFDPHSTRTSIALPELAPGSGEGAVPEESGVGAVGSRPRGAGVEVPTAATARLDRRQTPMLFLLGFAGALVVAALIGVLVAVVSDDGSTRETPVRVVVPTSPTPEAAEEEHAPVTIRFVEVPDGVSLFLDGEPLPDTELRAAYSEQIRHVRADVGGREVWRGEFTFTSDNTIDLAFLSELVPDERVPEAAQSQARTDRRQPQRATMEPRTMESRTMAPRLDDGIITDYP